MPTRHEAATTLLAAAREAARRVAEHQRLVARQPVGRDLKRDRYDIVTEHDRACEAIAVAALREAVPGCRIVGEEGGESVPTSDDGAGGLGTSVTFYVDPIDGTANFASGSPMFCVSIGAAWKGQMVAGVVNAPLLGQEWFADDETAWVQGFDTDGPVLLPGPVERTEAESVILTGFPSSRDVALGGEGVMEDFIRATRAVLGVRSTGSAAIELAFVASGWADACFMTGVSSWDAAAGEALVRAAGGTIERYPMIADPSSEPVDWPGYLAVAPGRDVPEIRGFVERLSAQRQEMREG